jgi:hypothetical protein
MRSRGRLRESPQRYFFATVDLGGALGDWAAGQFARLCKAAALA